MKAVIVLGAGASHGSIDVIGGTPPLGQYLFHELEKQGGQAAKISEELKLKFYSDFESGMLSYFMESKGNVMAFQRELAQYLAKFTPGPNNTYKKLIDTFKNQEVIYCSLNYDLLLEMSAQHEGLIPCYGPMFPSFAAKFLKILKIHGSSNFWPKTNSRFINCTIYGGGVADVEAHIETLDQQQTLLRCKEDDTFAPSMSMYARGKRVLISPKFIDQQMQIWRQSANAADFIFIIGVKVHLVDEHIWNVIASSKAKIVYFGFPSDEAAFMEWRDKFGKVDSTFHQADFEYSIELLQQYIKNN